MTQPTCLHDRPALEAYLRRTPTTHIYELGDLDDFFWPYTTWYALQEQGEIQALALVYTGTLYPVLAAMSQLPQERLGELLELLQNFLPWRFYTHLSPGLAPIFEAHYACTPHGLHYKMALADPGKLAQVDTSGVFQLTPGDAGELADFYTRSYPDNWFDPRMLETGCYYGIRQAGEIASVAGIHVYSPQYGVAALGNITTLPQHRNRGLGKAVTARLCNALLERVPVVGLNVKADNLPAIAAYRRLGFEVVSEYEEWALERTV